MGVSGGSQREAGTGRHDDLDQTDGLPRHQGKNSVTEHKCTRQRQEVHSRYGTVKLVYSDMPGREQVVQKH